MQVNGKYLTSEHSVPARPMLAETLKAIVENGFDEFYTGTVSTKVLNDFTNVCKMGQKYCRSMTDLITAEDLSKYKCKERDPFKFRYNLTSGHHDVYTAGAPYSGPALAVFLGIVTSKHCVHTHTYTHTHTHTH